MMAAQQDELREMDSESRYQWFLDHSRRLHSIGMFTIQVDGHLVANGYGPEEDTMFAKFNAFVDGPDVVAKAGGMG